MCTFRGQLCRICAFNVSGREEDCGIVGHERRLGFGTFLAGWQRQYGIQEEVRIRDVSHRVDRASGNLLPQHRRCFAKTVVNSVAWPREARKQVRHHQEAESRHRLWRVHRCLHRRETSAKILG